MISIKISLLGCVALVALLFISNVSAQTGSTWNYRTMKAYGANLGGWVSLERWIAPGLFERHAPTGIDEWTFSQLAANPAVALNDHWSTWITEHEFKIFANANGNHLRIPVGYWAFITPDVGEPYVPTGQKPHLERILGYCAKYNMHAIIDLHGLPGSQNGEHHSGRTGPIEFYSEYNQARSVRTVQAVVDWVNSLNATLKSRIAGVQPVNEPHIETAAELVILKQFYTTCYDIISASPYRMAMVFHDGFQGREAFSDFLPSTANAVLDLHPYHAFPPQTNKDEIITTICSRATYQQNFHLPIIFGEWSLSSGIPNDNNTWFRQMMDSQVYAYKNGGCGFTFWTLKNFAVADPQCESTEISIQQLYYSCFEGIAWSLTTQILEGIVTDRTFSETPNQQCVPTEATTNPTPNPTTTTSATTTSSPNSAVLAGSNVFLLMVCLIVGIKMVMQEMQ